MKTKMIGLMAVVMAAMMIAPAMADSQFQSNVAVVGEGSIYQTVNIDTLSTKICDITSINGVNPALDTVAVDGYVNDDLSNALYYATNAKTGDSASIINTIWKDTTVLNKWNGKKVTMTAWVKASPIPNPCPDIEPDFVKLDSRVISDRTVGKMTVANNALAKGDYAYVGLSMDTVNIPDSNGWFSGDVVNYDVSAVTGITGGKVTADLGLSFDWW